MMLVMSSKSWQHVVDDNTAAVVLLILEKDAKTLLCLWPQEAQVMPRIHLEVHQQ